MKNEERIETLNRKASRTIIIGVLITPAAEVIAIQSGVLYVAVPLLIGSVCLLSVSLYYVVLLMKEKRKVKT